MPTNPALDHAALRKLAEEAHDPPGTWIGAGSGRLADNFPPEECAFISAASPSVVLGLLDEMDHYLKAYAGVASELARLTERGAELEGQLSEVDALIEQYGIDTWGTGPPPPKKEQDRVDELVERATLRHEAGVRAITQKEPARD